MKQVRLHITGNVQGVFYRGSASAKASALGITGYVQNEHDRSVTAVAEGPKAILHKFIMWCEHGPDLARVDSVDVEWHEYTGKYTDFRIRR